MAAEYKWFITQLECYPKYEGYDDVVFNIHWRRQAVDNTHISSVYGSQIVTLDPAAPFTPFADVTEAQVENWLVSALGNERIAELDDTLVKQLANQISPTSHQPPLPWATA